MIIVPQSTTLPFILFPFSSVWHTHPFPSTCGFASLSVNTLPSALSLLLVYLPALPLLPLLLCPQGQVSGLLGSITHLSKVSGTSCSISGSSFSTAFNTVTFQACGEVLGGSSDCGGGEPGEPGKTDNLENKERWAPETPKGPTGSFHGYVVRGDLSQLPVPGGECLFFF